MIYSILKDPYIGSYLFIRASQGIFQNFINYDNLSSICIKIFYKEKGRNIRGIYKLLNFLMTPFCLLPLVL